MTRLYGVMVGANCAVLSVYTTAHKYYNSTDKFTANYKKEGDASYTTIERNSNIFRFLYSGYEFDVYGLEPQTTYDIYVNVDSEESNHITFTTESLGVFNYELTMRSDVTDVESGLSISLINSFAENMVNIGYDITPHSTKYTPKFTACTNDYLVDKYGAQAVTHGRDSYIEFDAYDTKLRTIIHEYRHLMFFSGGYNISYASENAGSISDPNVLYKTFSFFSHNDNKTEIYMYYGENNCYDTQYLYDYFVLKAISNNPVTIVYGN